ncbi:MAG: hypothetical protein VW443_11975, partial [Pseudomonadales bacterium]
MSILNYEATSDDGFGNIEKVTAQTEPSKARFNPMQSWMNASKVIDQEFSRPAAQTFAANVPENIQPYAQVQNVPFPQQLSMDGMMTPQEQALADAYQGVPVSNREPQDAASLGFPNMPYDLTGGQSQGATPDPVQAAALGAMYSPEAVEAQVMGGMPVMTADQQFDQGAMQPSPTPFDDDWMRAQEQGGSNPQQIQRADAIIKTASMQNDGSNTAGGVDASNDPIMVRRLGALASDPAKRREAYMKRLNTAFMQSIALDAMASIMKVPSRAAQFMEMTQKAIDAEMKFDDEERLAEINRAVFFPGGVYDPPANAREAFDRAIRANATPEEAAAISGHLPEGEEIGFDSYYRERPDGSVETIYVPKGQAPPMGSTPASGVATHNADLLAPAAAGKDPTDIAVPKEIMRLEENAKKLEEEGRVEEARDARMLADMIRQKAFGSRSNVLSDKRMLFDSLFGPYYESERKGKVPTPFFALPSRTENGEVIPESEREPLTKDDLFFLFSNSPDVIDVYDRYGKKIQINPYSLFSSPNAGINPYPKDVSINILRANPDMETLQQFVDVYGAEA